MCADNESANSVLTKNEADATVKRHDFFHKRKKFLKSQEVQTWKVKFRPGIFKVLDAFALNVPRAAVED